MFGIYLQYIAVWLLHIDFDIDYIEVYRNIRIQ